jgi:hypothetical protein
MFLFPQTFQVEPLTELGYNGCAYEPLPSIQSVYVSRYKIGKLKVPNDKNPPNPAMAYDAVLWVVFKIMNTQIL